MTDQIVKKMLWIILAMLLIVSAAVFFLAPNSRAATPEGNFDLWLHETYEYLDNLQKAEVAEKWGAAGWSEVVEVELARIAAVQAELAAAQARARTSTSTAPRVTASNSVSGQCGGATNGADRYIAQESGGDPNIYNTQGSGAWGCYQLMPLHFGSGGVCNDMTYGSATPAQQAECASRLPLSAWGG